MHGTTNVKFIKPCHVLIILTLFVYNITIAMTIFSYKIRNVYNISIGTVLIVTPCISSKYLISIPNYAHTYKFHMKTLKLLRHVSIMLPQHPVYTTKLISDQF